MNLILFFGTLFGLLSVMIAAYIDHALGSFVSDRVLKSLQTAMRYHQLYAIIVSLIGLFYPLLINNRMKSWLMRAAYLFIFGVIFFSFSIYLSAILNVSWISFFTPIGGILLMAGWACLMRVSLFRIRN